MRRRRTLVTEARFEPSRHAATQLHAAYAYGYRYVRTADGAPSHFEVDMEKAAVVRQIFDWVVNEQAPMNQVARRLDAKGIATPASAARWGLSTIHAILRNPA